jgi:hypothetical protein
MGDGVDEGVLVMPFVRYNDLIVELPPPPNRIGKCTDGDLEKHFTEAAVMLAYAMHLLESVPGTHTVMLCPDGEHAKRFGIRKWLETHGFRCTKTLGSTAYGGEYTRGHKTIIVSPKSGQGDVVVDVNGSRIVAECKGGIINTRHPGQISRLRKGLCEAVGLLMANAERCQQVAVVPFSDVTQRLAERMISRTVAAGIDISLVRADESVHEVHPQA